MNRRSVTLSPSAQTQFVYPDALSPTDLDAYLAAGWYRIAQSMMTCQFLVFGGHVRSAVWTRSRLAGHRFSANVRKLMARNDRRFTVRHDRARIDPVRDALYQRYCAHVGGDRPEDLQEFCYGGRNVELFDTREITIWDGDELVALSYYDRSADGMQSLLGAYDPTRRDASLGLYTLLCEVRHGIKEGLSFHYAGYVVPGDPRMSYKLRAGAIEFLDDRTGEWTPWARFVDADAPLERLLARLEPLRQQLHAAGIGARVQTNESFLLPARHEELRMCLDQPAVLVVPLARQSSVLLVTYREPSYRIEIGSSAEARLTYFGRPDGPHRQIGVWIVERTLADDIPASAVLMEVALRTRV